MKSQNITAHFRNKSVPVVMNFDDCHFELTVTIKTWYICYPPNE